MKQLIWDLPTRLFHWLFAFSFLAAFAIAKVAEKETPFFYLHVVFAVLAGLLLVWRIVWGFFGSKHARWNKLFFSPQEIVNYLKQVVAGKGVYYSGHNPASGMVILAMLALVLLTLVSGALISQNESLEEVHEVLPAIALMLAIVHVVGVVLATKMHQENYALSMFSGYKKATPGEAIPHSSGFAAVFMLVFVFALWGVFVKGFDRNTATLSIPGTQLHWQVGESEGGEGAREGRAAKGTESSAGKFEKSESKEHESEIDDD